MSLSIYTSFYNIQSAGFDWKSTLQNWVTFLDQSGEIVVVVNTSTDNTARLVREYLTDLTKIPSRITFKVIEAAIPYTDPEFDGKLKALALSHCTHPFAILLDCDELLVPYQRDLWSTLARDMVRDYSFDAYLVPVVDLIGDEEHVKGVGSKWYIHRNRPDITRGVHQQAYREDGSIDKTKSDTTELIYKDSRQIVRARSLLIPSFPLYMTLGNLENGNVPFVVHLGWLNKEKRLKQSAFWRSIWDLRDGGHSQEPELTAEAFDKIPRFKHNLPPWK